MGAERYRAKNSRLSLTHLDLVNSSPEPQHWYRDLFNKSATEINQRFGWPFARWSTSSRSQPGALTLRSQPSSLPIRATPGNVIPKGATPRAWGKP
jgi:hypothetical protein